MIILDTNIVSELMKPLPAQSLLAWLDQQESDTLYITSVTVGEIMYGLHALPAGKRRTLLESAFKQVLTEAFTDRSFPFDDGAAVVYGKIMSLCKEKGRVMSVCDGQIAAISIHQRCQLATRNVKDFESCGITLVNPLAIDRTEIVVELSRFGEEALMSRSQAKKILRNLEDFSVITLDFKGVEIVGQGFADEVFRVYQNEYPDKQIKYIHGNKDVTFMIDRVIATALKFD